jgi:hypothetical protein
MLILAHKRLRLYKVRDYTFFTFLHLFSLIVLFISTLQKCKTQIFDEKSNQMYK